MIRARHMVVYWTLLWSALFVDFQLDSRAVCVTKASDDR